MNEVNSRLVARSAIYRILSLGFSYPEREILDFLGEGLAGKLKEALQLLPETYRESLAPGVKDLESAQAFTDELEGEYERLFRTELLSTPYETEYDPMRSVRKGQELADILGFYRAFGLAPSERRKELPDHIAVELEFMSLLLQKEAYAGLNGWSEKVEVSIDAQRKFLRDHLGAWVFTFCDRVEENSRLDLYLSLAGLLRKFMELELRELGVEPLRLESAFMPSEQGELSCPFSRASPVDLSSLKS